MADPTRYERVLENMIEAGANMAKPAGIWFYLYFSKEELASAAADHLSLLGYESEFHRAPTKSLFDRLFAPPRFCCTAHTWFVPTASNVSNAIDLMHSVAEQHDGEYDGWEASIET